MSLFFYFVGTSFQSNALLIVAFLVANDEFDILTEMKNRIEVLIIEMTMEILDLDFKEWLQFLV